MDNNANTKDASASDGTAAYVWNVSEHLTNPTDEQKKYYHHDEATLEKIVYAGMGHYYAFYRMRKNQSKWFTVLLGGSDYYGEMANRSNFMNGKTPRTYSFNECIKYIQEYGLKP